ncbi:glucokinase [Pusillimonas sp. SM2304]|uniref:glucokinase n=1 Tax=Pusillimonas sp. SM2304 TaxID=3073241 RepID=UPI002874718D|nr:glucokinase [Pusillimonas sp. SM2304]MDS1142198.1 glucokinase [Pusillimonas sp. SM2304]
MSTGTTDTQRRLIADIGGTHARFALCSPACDIEKIDVLDSAAFPTLEAAVRHYLHRHGNPPVRHAVFGMANPVLGDHIAMTNYSWSFSIEDLRRRLGLESLHVINDFTALALALPRLTPAELRRVGGGEPVAGTPLGLLGPGTGLGVSALIPNPAGGWIPLAAEGGHVSFAPRNDCEQMLWRAAASAFGHVSMERLVSGSGLAFIYRSLCLDRGMKPQDHTPADISRLAIAGQDPICLEALDAFCAMLGTAASDLAVTLGARGGIYIGGGIIPKLGDYFPRSPFRQRFDDKGRFAAYLAAIPVFVIDSANPALLGAAAYLDNCHHE